MKFKLVETTEVFEDEHGLKYRYHKLYTKYGKPLWSWAKSETPGSGVTSWDYKVTEDEFVAFKEARERCMANGDGR